MPSPAEIGQPSLKQTALPSPSHGGEHAVPRRQRFFFFLLVLPVGFLVVQWDLGPAIGALSLPLLFWLGDSVPLLKYRGCNAVEAPVFVQCFCLFL